MKHLRIQRLRRRPRNPSPIDLSSDEGASKQGNPVPITMDFKKQEIYLGRIHQ